MTQVAEHPVRKNQTWQEDQWGDTATTTMEHVDLTEIPATLGRLKQPGLLAKQNFYVSATSPGFITLTKSSSGVSWSSNAPGTTQFHSGSIAIGEIIEIIFFWPPSQQSSDPDPVSSIGKVFVVEGGEPAPDWLSRIEEAFQSLLTLPENWDSYGARMIEPRAVQAAIALLRSIVQRGTPQPAVVPTNRGGIQIEWHTCGIDLEIEIMAPGEVRVFYENPQENAETELQLSSDLKPITDFIAKVSHPR